MPMYLSGTVPFLHKVLFPFTYLWYKMMGSPTDSEDIFPTGEVAIESWKRTLARLPLQEDEANLPSLVATRNNTVVTKLYLCKQTKTISKHEYLVAELRREDHRQVHAYIERYRGSPEEEEREIARRTQMTIGDAETILQDTTNGSVRLTSSSPSSQLAARAKDTVRFCPGGFSGSNVVKYYVFEESREPTLIDLAVAAFVAHEYDSIYTLFLHQCYWYADVICAILESIVDGRYQVITPRNEAILGETKVFLDYQDLEALDPASATHQTNERVEAIVPLRQEQWTSLKQGYNIVKISTRQPRVVKSLRCQFEKVKNEFREKEKFATNREEERRRTQRVIEEQDKALEERDHALAERDRALARQAKELEDLRAFKAQTIATLASGSSRR